MLKKTSQSKLNLKLWSDHWNVIHQNLPSLFFLEKTAEVRKWIIPIHAMLICDWSPLIHLVSLWMSVCLFFFIEHSNTLGEYLHICFSYSSGYFCNREDSNIIHSQTRKSFSVRSFIVIAVKNVYNYPLDWKTKHIPADIFNLCSFVE